MLSIEQCRRLLGNADLTDEEIAEIRADLNAAAVLLVDLYVENPALFRSLKKTGRKPKRKKKAR